MEKILKGLISFFTILILFTPLYVSKKTFFPFIFGKIILFQSLVEIIFFLWILLVFLNKSYLPNFKNPFFVSFSGFILILTLTGLLGIDPLRSFFSTNERMTGIFTFIHLYLWVLVLTSTFKKFSQWKIFLISSLIASVLVGLLGIKPLFLKKTIPHRISSTLGNPIFFSAYLMIHFFLALFLATIFRKKILKILFLFFALGNFFLMALGGSRGVFLGALGGILSFLFLASFLSPKRKLRIAFSLISIFILSAFFLSQLPFGKKTLFKLSPALSRSLDFKIPPDRIWAWQIAVKGFFEKPFLGWGWENFNIIFNLFYNPKYQIYFFQELTTWYDRSHNQVLDILSLTGIFGALFYLFIFFYLEIELLKKLKKYFFSSAILFSLILAYFIQNLFVFDTPAPLISFYFLLAFSFFYIEKEKVEKIKESEGKISQKFFLSFLFLPLILTSFYFFNLKPYLQSRMGALASQVAKIDLKRGLFLYKKILKDPYVYSPEIRLIMTKIFLESKKKGELRKEALEFSAKEMKKNIKEHPKDVKFYLALGKIYLSLKKIDKAEEILLKAIPLSPTRQEIYYTLGELYLRKRNYSKAVQFFKKAVDLDPTVPQSHFFYGISLILKGDYIKGIKEVELAKEKGVPLGKRADTLATIALGYLGKGDFKKAIHFSNLALKYEKNHPPSLYIKSLAYLSSGKEKKAKEIYLKLEKIEPNLAKRLKNLAGF